MVRDRIPFLEHRLATPPRRRGRTFLGNCWKPQVGSRWVAECPAPVASRVSLPGIK